MERIIKCGRAMGWCWCWPKKRLEDGYDLEDFLNKRPPIFWVMGPPLCGKTTIAKSLARCSDYYLIQVSDLVKKEIAKGKWRGKVMAEFKKNGGTMPNEIILNLFKEIFHLTCEIAIGYIIDGFPLNMAQAKQFEFEICKVFIIIYPTLSLDAFTQRVIDRKYDADLKTLTERHKNCSRMCQEVYRHYEQKTLKCVTVYSNKKIMHQLVFDLQRYFGYQFRYLSDIHIS